MTCEYRIVVDLSYPRRVADKLIVFSSHRASHSAIHPEPVYISHNQCINIHTNAFADPYQVADPTQITS